MNSDIKCTAEKKVNKDFFINAKILISIANLACKCYAQNLGPKVTNHRRGSFPKGQKSWRQIFFEHVLPRCFKINGYFTKKLCYLLFSISVVIGQFSFNWLVLSNYWLSTIFIGDCRIWTCSLIINYVYVYGCFKKTLVNILPSWPSAWSMSHISHGFAFLICLVLQTCKCYSFQTNQGYSAFIHVAPELVSRVWPEAKEEKD